MKRSGIAAAILAGVACGPLPARAAEAPGWLERAASAESVVVGRAGERSSGWEGGRIFTYAELAVEESVRGPETGGAIVVRQPGGIVGEIGQRVTHVTLLRPGERYLLFLVRDEAGEWTTTALGVNPVVAGANGEPRVAGEPLSAVVRALRGGS